MKTAIPARMELKRLKVPTALDADEIEQRPFDAQVGERLVQTLEHSIYATFCCALSSISPSSKDGGKVGAIRPRFIINYLQTYFNFVQ